MKPTIIFHIGIEKTGTDSFQRFCKENHRLLRQYSALYPMNNLAFASYNHAALVACYLPYRDFSIQARRRERADVVRSLRHEIDSSGASTVLLSAEHLSSRFGDAEIRQLASDFADYECRAAVAVRDHVARACSAYCQTIISGRFLTIDEFCSELARPDNKYARYRETIGPWEEVFGKDRMSVFVYARGQNIIETLCAAFVSPAMPLSGLEAYRDNRSLGAGAIEALRLVNKSLARPGQKKIDVSRDIVKWALLYRLRASIVKTLAKNTPDQSADPVRLGARNTALLCGIAEADCRWLAEHYGVHLPIPAVAESDHAAPAATAGEAKALVERTLAGRLTKIFQANR
jgi:hypothetical protein